VITDETQDADTKRLWRTHKDHGRFDAFERNGLAV
jgi:hypothetical protein